jgi:hypothetical protein
MSHFPEPTQPPVNSPAPSQEHEIFKRVHDDLIDSYDEELEMEVDDAMLPEWQVPETQAEKDAAKASSASWGSVTTENTRSFFVPCQSSREC